jgi:cysteine-rich repeat protein
MSMKKVNFFDFVKINFSKMFIIKKTKRFKISLILLLILGFFVGNFLVIKNYKNKYASAQTGVSPDAIAIRVIPNQNSYSALRWYKEQKFSGSPQSILVDGYEAVRDGRTVYVNAANTVDTNSDGTPDELYTNIYLISYNQEAEDATADIFGRILGDWKFNTNLPQPGTGKCSIASALPESEWEQCLTDSDCKGKGFCGSLKARITRDVLRLSHIADMKTSVANYAVAHNNKYPTLSAGTYIANHSISSWPSWSDTFSKELGVSLPKDPVNKLGPCSGFDPATCWNEQNKKFADPTNDGKFNLPDFSYGYVYEATAIGDDYKLCANMETGGSFSNIVKDNCAGNKMGNAAPEIIKINLPQEVVGAIYKGYAEAIDPDGDLLTWSITCAPANWGNNWNPSCPQIKPAQTANQKMIYANTTGAIGNYNFTLTVDDGRGGVFSKDYTIYVASAASTCVDNDTDGYDICIPSNPSDDGLPADCNDTNGNINPGRTENCTNTIDDNCNNLADCADTACSSNPICGAVCGDGNCEVNKDECAMDCTGSNDCTAVLCCGNGKIESSFSEQCDDGNGNNKDECNACEKTYCGDTITQNNSYNSNYIVEQCDDGNTNENDTCNRNCQAETPNENCTDGECNGFCPPGCTIADDPDCGCSPNNECCGRMCTAEIGDNDCIASCNDDFCDLSKENCATCSIDCDICLIHCEDGTCDKSIGEDVYNNPNYCSQDCFCTFPLTFPCALAG